MNDSMAGKFSILSNNSTIFKNIAECPNNYQNVDFVKCINIKDYPLESLAGRNIFSTLDPAEVI